jgi:hypothetical protein
MTSKMSFWGAVLALVVVACGPQPTETPGITPFVPSAVPSSVPRLATPVLAKTDMPQPSPTPFVETLQPTPLPTARVHLYDDVDEATILATVFPGLTLTPDAQGYQVEGSQDWVVWLNDREEGHITKPDTQQLVAIVANQVGSNPPREEAPYGSSSDLIVVLERRDGKLTVTQREVLMPQVSPLSSDVRIERTADPGHDGQDDLLLTINAVQSLIIRTEAHLYRWQAGKFVELWNGVEQDDNTAAVNQESYFSYQATIKFADLDNDGIDEIVVNGKRTLFAKDADGRADLTSPSSVTDEQSVYKWNGELFVLDAALTTPAPLVATATP